MKPIHLAAALVVAAIAGQAVAQDPVTKRLDQLEAQQAFTSQRLQQLEGTSAAILSELKHLTAAVEARAATPYPAAITTPQALTVYQQPLPAILEPSPIVYERVGPWRLRWPHRVIRSYVVYP
jgi:hypothetical protein